MLSLYKLFLTNGLNLNKEVFHTTDSKLYFSFTTDGKANCIYLFVLIGKGAIKEAKSDYN